MKKIISLLIGCSLGLAGAALAQQPDEQQSPSKGNHASQKAHAAQAQSGPNATGPQQKPSKETGAMKERGAANGRGMANERGATNERTASNESGAQKGRKTHAGRETANAPESNASAERTSGPANEPASGKNRKARATERTANAPTSTEKQQAEQQSRAEQQRKDVKTPAAAAKTSGNLAAAGTNAGAPNSATSQQNVQANAGAKAKKPAQEEVQQVKSQHANFRAQPKPQQVPPVTFNQNHRIEGSDQWQGTQYQVFRSYHPEWHDQAWYRSHYSHVELIGGGYYYFNNGYWFPAWGYSPSDQYYAYDGPIYVGHAAEPPDKVIADTQALLQQMGYYRGEVDGLLGPLTREALAAYQGDHGLTTTAAIDQPTLDSLGLA
jgi:hypothetical protein